MTSDLLDGIVEEIMIWLCCGSGVVSFVVMMGGTQLFAEV